MSEIQTFIRRELQAPSAPPPVQRGLIRWLHQNLLSSWLNVGLTLTGIAMLWLMLAATLPWLTHGVWRAASLGECREIDATGACWAMVRERWNQFIFGFYPSDLYWRPILAFALMIVALTPVLFFGRRRICVVLVGAVGILTMLVLIALGTPKPEATSISAIVAALALVAWFAPRRLLWASLLFPLVGFQLLWGGSIWTTASVAFGFVLFAGVWWFFKSRAGAAAVGLGLIASMTWWISAAGAVAAELHSRFPFGLEPVPSDKFGGFLLAFVIGVTAIAASLPMGVILALGRRSDMFLLRALSICFIEFVRGVPLIAMLFTASLLLQYFLPPQTNFDLILRVIILVTIFSSAYIAEVIRGGLAALPRGQSEAADALGLDYWQAQRLIIMPQAMKLAIPGIVSCFIAVFKDTTLVALVGLADPLQGITRIVRADMAWKSIYWEPFVFVGALFFVICFGMSRYAMALERKLKRDHR